MIKCLIWLFRKGARQIPMMSAKFPTPEDRKRLLHSFYDLPPKDKEMLYRAVEHLRWLTISLGPGGTQPKFHAQYSGKTTYTARLQVATNTLV